MTYHSGSDIPFPLQNRKWKPKENTEQNCTDNVITPAVTNNCLKISNITCHHTLYSSSLSDISGRFPVLNLELMPIPAPTIAVTKITPHSIFVPILSKKF